MGCGAETKYIGRSESCFRRCEEFEHLGIKIDEEKI